MKVTVALLFVILAIVALIQATPIPDDEDIVIEEILPSTAVVEIQGHENQSERKTRALLKLALLKAGILGIGALGAGALGVGALGAGALGLGALRSFEGHHGGYGHHGYGPHRGYNDFY